MKDVSKERKEQKQRLSACLQDLYGNKVERNVIDKAVDLHYHILHPRLVGLLSMTDDYAADAFCKKYGLGYEAPMTLAELSEQMNRGREYIRQDIERAKAYLGRLPQALALFADTNVVVEDDPNVFRPCLAEVDVLTKYLIQHEMRDATPFAVDDDGYLVSLVNMAKYTQLYHELVIPQGTKVIPVGAFAGCGENLTAVVLPDTLEVIEREAFANTWLRSLICPGSLRQICDRAFYNCCCLSDVQFNKGLRVIGESAFWGCDSIKKIRLPRTLTTIGNDAFEYTECAEISLPPSVSTCGWTAFTTHVKSLSHWLSLQRKGSMGHTNVYIDGCRLASPILPEGLRELKPNAFCSCNIDGIRLPSTLRRIGAGALDYTRVSHLYLPDGFVELECTMCMPDLQSIRVPDTIRRFDLGFPDKTQLLSSCNEDENGILYYGNETNPYVVAVCARYAKSDVVRLPDGCRIVGIGCFEGTRIKEVVLPQSIVQICNRAFADCTRLARLDMPPTFFAGKRRLLGNEVFDGCTNLRSLHYEGQISDKRMLSGDWRKGSRIGSIIGTDGTFWLK